MDIYTHTHTYTCTSPLMQKLRTFLMRQIFVADYITEQSGEKKTQKNRENLHSKFLKHICKINL